MSFDRRLYHPSYFQRREEVKNAAGRRCARCGKKEGEKTVNRFGREIRVVLTTAHLDHDPWNPEARLLPLCYQCHLRYDASHGQRFRKKRMMAIARGQLVLFGEEGLPMPP